MIRRYVPYVVAVALLAAVWWRCDWTIAALCVVVASVGDYGWRWWAGEAW